MHNEQNLKRLYSNILNEFKEINIDSVTTEEELLKIIYKAKINNDINLIEENNFSLTQLSELFRFYEDSLDKFYLSNEELFEIKFNIYLLLIDLFKQLCKIYSTKHIKRDLIEPILEILIESKNILKLRLPLSKEKIALLNNQIGENRYKFTHIPYIDTKSKEIDYALQVYLLNLERIIHGFELSKAANFRKLIKTSKETEEYIFINNISFLILKMFQKIDLFYIGVEFTTNKYFTEIENLYNEFTFNKLEEANKNKEFKNSVLNNFISTSKYLEEQGIAVIDEKLQLLKLNTDEYKQLIDIISRLKKCD